MGEARRRGEERKVSGHGNEEEGKLKVTTCLAKGSEELSKNNSGDGGESRARIFKLLRVQESIPRNQFRQPM